MVAFSKQLQSRVKISPMNRCFEAGTLVTEFSLCAHCTLQLPRKSLLGRRALGAVTRGGTMNGCEAEKLEFGCLNDLRRC
jgi:hypothetical protein